MKLCLKKQQNYFFILSDMKSFLVQFFTAVALIALALNPYYTLAQGTNCSTTLLDEPFNSPSIVGANGPVLYGNGGSNHNSSLIMSGGYFGWFNIVNGISNVDVYDRTATVSNFVCPIDASIWIRESYGGTNVTLSLIDDNNAVLADTTLTLTSVYQQITLTALPTTSTFRYVIHFNGTGGNGLDIATEDLLISQTCNVEAEIDSIASSQCFTGNSFAFNGSQSTANLGISSYDWDFGDGNTSNNANNTHPYSSTGSYTATLTVSDNTGCSDTETTTVSVLLSPSIDAIANLEICDSYTLPAITGTNLTGGEAYYTAPGGTGTSYNAGDVITSSDTLYVFDGTTNCNDEVSFSVVINTLNLDLGNDTLLCEGPTITLDAGNPTANYLWNNGTTNQTFDADTSGLFQVVVTDTNGCVETDSIQLTFEMLPDAGANGSNDLCNTVSTFDLNTLLANTSGQSFSWSEITAQSSGQLNTNGVLNLNNLSGTYNFIYIAAGGVCANDTASFSIDVFEPPFVGQDNQASQCSEDGPINLNTLLSSGVSNAGVWTETTNPISGGLNAASGSFNTSGLSSGSYTFTYEVDELGPCPASIADFTINVTANPDVSFSVEDPDGCIPFTAEFINNSVYDPAGATCAWNFGDGNGSSVCGDVEHEYTSAGCYDVSLSIESQGCSTTVAYSDLVCVYEQPIASFTYGPNTIYIEDPTVEYINNSQYATNYSWTFGDGFSSTVENPIHLFPLTEPGDYTTTLYAFNDVGCVDSTNQVITIQDHQVFYVPNAFTPDGDVLNQTFDPVFTSGFDPNNYRFSVYNRWGELLFESFDYQRGWDGTYGGKMMPEGVYIWKIEFKDEFTDERSQRQGHVNLLR
jgi:gliding motility-associated-like protein